MHFESPQAFSSFNILFVSSCACIGISNALFKIKFSDLKKEDLLFLAKAETTRETIIVEKSENNAGIKSVT